MKDYFCLSVRLNESSEYLSDILSQELADIGFESFETENLKLKAYAPIDGFDKNILENVINNYKDSGILDTSEEIIKGKDWNQEWEQNYFKPIVIDGKCVIHASFHKDYPKAPLDILIDPKMAFGTGHHSTTACMSRFVMEEDLAEKYVIDMGTGTGILSFIAKSLGAKKVLGIEIDPFAWENAKENALLNNLEIDLVCGDASALHNAGEADILLANINRNIILNDLAKYSKAIRNNGLIFLSGFYKEDIPVILKKAEYLNLKLVASKEDNNWVALKFIKNEY